MGAEPVITRMVPEARLDELRLVVKPELRDVPDLGVGVAIGRLRLDLDLTHVGTAYPQFGLSGSAPASVPVSSNSHHHASKGLRL